MSTGNVGPLGYGTPVDVESYESKRRDPGRVGGVGICDLPWVRV